MSVVGSIILLSTWCSLYTLIEGVVLEIGEWKKGSMRVLKKERENREMLSHRLKYGERQNGREG